MSGWKFKAGTILFAAFMTLGSYMGVPLSWRELALASVAGQPVATRATLLAAEPTRFAFTRNSSRFVGSTEVTRYRYRFKDSSGTLRDGHSYRTGGSDTIEHDGPNGREIDIVYGSSRPSINFVVGGTLSPVPIVFSTIYIPAALALLMLGRGVLAGSRRVRLLQSGTLASGRVVSRRINNTDRPLKPGEDINAVDIEVTFTTESGQSVTHKERVVDNPAEVGDQPQELVLYDPADPRRAMLLDGVPGRPAVGPDGQWQPTSGRAVIVVALFLLIHVSWIWISYALLAPEW